MSTLNRPLFFGATWFLQFNSPQDEFAEQAHKNYLAYIEKLKSSGAGGSGAQVSYMTPPRGRVARRQLRYPYP